MLSMVCKCKIFNNRKIAKISHLDFFDSLSMCHKTSNSIKTTATKTIDIPFFQKELHHGNFIPDVDDFSPYILYLYAVFIE